MYKEIIMQSHSKIFLSILLITSSINTLYSKEQKNIILESKLLEMADKSGAFHGPIIDILKTRADLIAFNQGEKTWKGSIISIDIDQSHESLEIYCRRPELLFGATFITISPDHPFALDITIPSIKNTAYNYIETFKKLTYLERQNKTTNDALFTGAYGINPLTKERLPIYITDDSIECFDVRKGKTHLGFSAHNSKDLEFARRHNLPIKIVVSGPKTDAHGHNMALPLIDKQGNLKEAYLGEYKECFLINSGFLNNLSLEEAYRLVSDKLYHENQMQSHEELLLYQYNNTLYSIKDLAKIEATLYKNMPNHEHLHNDFRIILNYIQADLLEITEKFLINVKNTKVLMVALIEESCKKRENNNCYLSRWCHLEGNESEKTVFRRDIVTIRDFTIFCRDLVFFLGDLAHSCPNALDNVKRQNNK
jgi:hypothetical protein